jgi:hypothetical protein
MTRALPFNLFPPSSFSENVGAAIVGEFRAPIAHVPPCSPRFTEKNFHHSSLPGDPSSVSFENVAIQDVSAKTPNYGAPSSRHFM